MAKGSHGGKGSGRRKGAQDDKFRSGYDNIRWGVLDSESENDTGHETGHQSGLSRFVHAPEADRERVGEEVAERSIERQRELIHASPESGLVGRMEWRAKR